jgi:L-aminopeptidase/D-esterase-like protein
VNAIPKPRARDLGIPFDGTPGPRNAITDVAGVEVGHTTLIEGHGSLVVGHGPVRTGVTVVLPRGKHDVAPVYAGWFSFNGAGEMTGILALEEWGWLYGPIGLTNTHSVGVVRDALVAWSVRQGVRRNFHLPVVAETYDGLLNDTNGFHVTQAHTLAALDAAQGGLPAEGNVGGGTGMLLHGWKGGIGSASRRLDEAAGGYTVGVLVQGNYGTREALRIAGAPVGREILEPVIDYGLLSGSAAPSPGRGSIIVVVATDAPLLPHQLKSLAKRPTLALGRMGSLGGEFSGDIFLAFSTVVPRVVEELAAPVPPRRRPGYAPDTAARLEVATLPLTGLFSALSAAVVEATEEAIVNAMIAAEDMRGADDVWVPALPHAALIAALAKYNRLAG